MRRISLLWKIWLSTSVALTAMFALMGYLVQMSAQATATASIQEEVQSSSKAYKALWESRSGALKSLAALLSGMPASENALESLWNRAPEELRQRSFLALSDASGTNVRWLPSSNTVTLDASPLVVKAASHFPSQASGFFVQNSILYQVVLTPIYSAGKLSTILIAGFAVNDTVAQELREATGKSEFVFASRGQIFASTLDDRATGAVVRSLVLNPTLGIVNDGSHEYVPLDRDLVDFEGRTIGKLFILRSFADARESVSRLRRRIFFIWEAAIVLGLLLTYLVAERIVKPVKDLDRAASEVAMQNYDYRVSVESDDELGRLAATFNKMCESLQAARAELIRRERIATIGRLASSIVHDLRNPLAAIYGGSEMLMDTDPTPDQRRRIAENIYKASRRIQELLDDLVRVTRGKTNENEVSNLRGLVREAIVSLETAAQSQSVKLDVEIDPAVRVAADRPRLEGVFVNLVQNALDVMPQGGTVSIRATEEAAWVMVEVSDTGPGIAREVQSQLFQPFVSHGKRNGLGLGLALARQTVLDHGGDLWASSEEGKGARFFLRLPRPSAETPAG